MRAPSAQELQMIQQAKRQFDAIPRSVFQAISEMQQIPRSVFADFSRLSAAISSMRVTLPDSLFEFARVAASLPASLVELSRQWAEVAQEMHRSWKITEEAAQVLFDLGWWIYPDWSLIALRDMVRAHQEGKDQEIETAILNYFDEKRLDNMLASWLANRKLKSRLHILSDVIEAHKLGKYTLTIPTMLTQVEGLIVEHFSVKKRGGVKHPEVISLARQGLNGGASPGSMSFALSNGVVLFIEKLLKEQFEWGSTKRRAGRSAILHGRFVEYPSKAFSLKLILLIDYIQSVLNEDDNATIRG